MSDIKRAGQFKAQSAPVPSSSRGEAEESIMLEPPVKGKNGWLTKLVVIVLIIVVILVGLYLVSKYTSWNVLSVNKGVSNSGWQAVFLSNGQVYFGKIAKKNSETLVLREVYYLQVTQQLQPTPEDQSPQQNLSLVKLGNELHGPKDEMRLNRDHIIFTEDLKPDSRVVDAIIRYLEEQP